MNCPNCSFQQPPGLECINCGIVFEKYAARHGLGEPESPLLNSALMPQPDTAFPSAAVRPQPLVRAPDPHDLPIGDFAQFTRMLAGLGCVAIAVLMGLNGTAFRAFYPYAILLFFAGFGLWVLVTVRSRIRVRQFAIEMFVLVTVSLVLRGVYPEFFSMDIEPTAGSNAPIVYQPGPHDGWANDIEAFVIGVRDVLEGKSFSNREEYNQLVASVDGANIVTRYREYGQRSKDEQVKVYRSYALVQEISKQTRQLLPPPPTQGQDGQTTDVAVPDEFKETLEGKIKQLMGELKMIRGVSNPTTVQEAAETTSDG